MSFFGIFKSKEEKLNEAVREDLAFWSVMCTGIVTSPDFFRMFPPKEAYANMTTQKTWMLAAFYTIIIAIIDEKVFDDVILKIIKEEDSKSDEPLSPKFNELIDMWGDVTKNINDQIEYVKSVMNRIEAKNVRLAASWMFCKSFLTMVTISDKGIDFDGGADFLFDSFVRIMFYTSKTIQVCRSFFDK